MDLIILTGMSGAGKSQAANILEDQGYFCIDNLPPMVLPELVRTFIKGQGGEGFAIDKLAFVVDVRSNEYLKGFGKAMSEIQNLGCPYRIIFLEANDSVLVSRYRQTRRKHPLSAGLSLVEAIEKERSVMRGVRARATHIIDTSLITLSALREEILNIIEVEDLSTMDIHIESFGFKYGIPGDSDVTCDVRFLPNPFYIPELKMLCGKDEAIIKFLEEHEETGQYYEKMMDLLCFSIPFYIREGKARLSVGVGCTGGRHRSVYMAERLYEGLKAKGFRVSIHHRDIDKDPRYFPLEEKKA
ncbi:MAG: RNase adapter RapZ [Clostridiales bacterium]|nr:RNase adapter RapZ [Clostridiales bacterium]